MRRALATTALAAGLALGGAPLVAAPAFAAGPSSDIVVAQEAETGPDTGTGTTATDDDNDNTGKWGLAGLTGLFGLFGYKKYREHRAGSSRSNDTGTARPSGPIGDVDGDGSGSRRV